MDCRHVNTISSERTQARRSGLRIPRLMGCILICLWLAACAAGPKMLKIKEISTSYPPGTIFSTQKKAVVSFAELMADLNTVRVVYAGEQHTNPAHHAIQLKILTALHEQHPGLKVGMEMFDQTYQPVLDQWSAGDLDRKTFIEKVHWYVNWKFDFDLYSGILDYIKANHIPLIGLNIPPCIPPKIAAGGIDNLQKRDKAFLPETLHLSNSGYRDYLQKIFKMHHFMMHSNFENFYVAQNVWDDVMAESVVSHIDDHVMLVLAGNGHLIYGFGIPDRVNQHLAVPYRTILPLPAGESADLDMADYLWVTASETDHGLTE